VPLRSFSETEIVLKARRRLETPLLAMVWLSIAMVSVAEGNVYLFAAGTLAVAINLIATLSGKEVYLHRGIVYVLALLGSAMVVTEWLWPGTPHGLDDPLLLQAITHFIIVILLCKLFERKRNRDYVQMLTLSGLSALSASLVCDLLWYALLCLVYVVLAGYVGMALTLKRDLDRAAKEQLPGESAPPPPAQVAWNAIRDWPSAALRQRLTSTLLFMAVCGVLLFAAAPRLSEVVQPIASRGLQALSGLADTVRLGETKKVYLSDRIVMRIRVRDAGGQPIQPNPIQYFCASTSSRYEGSVWRQDKAPTVKKNDLPTPPRGGAVVQDISMRQDVLPHLPAGWPVVDVKAELEDWELTSSEVVRVDLTDIQVHHVRYRAFSWAGTLTAEQRRYLSTRRQRMGIIVDQPPESPDVPPRVIGLAQEWCEDILTERQANPSRRDELDLAIAHRISQRLGEIYPYSLDLSAADPSRDGVEDFLFHMKQGHCEYFASALAVMCQSLGVRARLAMGYRADEIDPQTGELIVRDRDAHAWCMVYTPSTDFVIVDPSPRPAELARSDGLWGQLTNWWEGVQFWWYERVVGYNARSRERLGEYLRGHLVAGVNWMRRRLQQAGQSLWNLFIHGEVDAALIRLTYILLAATGLVASLVLGRYMHHRWRLRRAYRTGQAVPAVQMAFMRRLIKQLRRKGLTAGADRTVQEVLNQAAQRFCLPTDAVEDVTSFYYRLRWGRRPAEPEELRAIMGRVDGLVRLIRT
jgi:hypothetical protein